MGSCDKRNDNMKRNDSDHEYEYDEYKVKDMGSCDKRNDNMKRNDSDHEYEYDEHKVKDMGSYSKRNDNMKRNEIFNIFKMGIENKYDIKGELNEKWEEDWSSDDMKMNDNIKFVRNTVYGELKQEDTDIDEKLKGNKKKLMGITNIKKIKKINIIILR